jgi:hypothetical protein
VTADLSHLGARVPDGQGWPGEADRRHAAGVSAMRHDLAAQAYVDALAGGNEGAAAQHLHRLQHDPESGVDPWRLTEAVAARALRVGAHHSLQR